MNVLSVSAAKVKLNKLVDRVRMGLEEVVITRNGRPAAVMVNPDAYTRWRETEDIRHDPELMREIRDGLQALDGGGKRMTFQDVFGEPLRPKRRA